MHEATRSLLWLALALGLYWAGFRSSSVWIRISGRITSLKPKVEHLYYPSSIAKTSHEILCPL